MSTLEDGISVHFEYTLSDGTKTDYVLCDRNGRPLTVIEAKRQSVLRHGYETSGCDGHAA